MYQSLRAGGKILLRMGGKGDAQGIVSAMDDVTGSDKWGHHFTDFVFPYTFLSVEDYEALLRDAGFSARRVELIPRDMTHAGRVGLAGWIRTTWLPYTGRIPSEKRDEFIEAVCSTYLDRVPLGPDGLAHVAMVMIEVEAVKFA